MFKSHRNITSRCNKIVVSDNTFSNSNIENCILKSDEEITKFARKVGITKGKTVRLTNVVNDKKNEAEQLIAREESTKSEAIISLLVNNEFKGFLFLSQSINPLFQLISQQII